MSVYRNNTTTDPPCVDKHWKQTCDSSNGVPRATSNSLTLAIAPSTGTTHTTRTIAVDTDQTAPIEAALLDVNHRNLEPPSPACSDRARHKRCPTTQTDRQQPANPGLQPTNTDASHARYHGHGPAISNPHNNNTRRTQRPDPHATPQLIVPPSHSHPSQCHVHVPLRIDVYWTRQDLPSHARPHITRGRGCGRILAGGSWFSVIVDWEDGEQGERCVGPAADDDAAPEPEAGGRGRRGNPGQRIPPPSPGHPQMEWMGIPRLCIRARRPRHCHVSWRSARLPRGGWETKGSQMYPRGLLMTHPRAS